MTSFKFGPKGLIHNAFWETMKPYPIQYQTQIVQFQKITIKNQGPYSQHFIFFITYEWDQ
jgi:hypothetical protein